MQNIFVSELLDPDEMRAFSVCYGIELIRFSISDELDRLPDDFAIQDNLGEFAEEPDAVEKQIYKDLHIAPLNMQPKGGDLKNAENT